MTKQQEKHQKAFRRFLYYQETQKVLFKEPSAHYETILRNLEETSEQLTLSERLEAENPVYAEFGIEI